ncbi:WecB/TagA/CpsF family glycosyltransferase [Enterococcus sp. BWT-B8]|uniref:WecB/TagA/CpsF family glycosyltransferase n=1 Tax=Enterococcus sp. BWT-B8 TaxID=2885157 RepID=UPI001E4905D5|nr:WecB/TagA/CpsF family glycosyltransferase [Enterococcus sp. BWT-B8]MCB5952934.1 WecB/TagA/CpsF family glycosyltransferase [Enterococcus sp. BWT-B8]
MKTEYIGGLPVDVLTHEKILEDIPDYLASNKKMIITSVNPQITLQAYEQPEVFQYIHRATHRIADGIGIVKMSKVTGGEITERITGIDVMDNCLTYANEYRKRIFLYGAKKEIVAQAAENIQKQYPNLVIADHLHGFTSKEEPNIVEIINEAAPDFLFVALGSPKQEIFLERHVEELNAKVFLNVGGTFDVLSGAVPRAPKFFLDHNIEWLYRSIKFHRYDRLIQIPQYIWKVMRTKRGK